MKAVGLYKYLSLEEDQSFMDLKIDKPKAKGHDLLVKVKAISVNPIDTKIRSRKEDDGSLLVLGYDASGIVEAIGDDVSLFSVGDEVFYAGDVTRQGTNSEYHLVDERIVGIKPKTLSYEDAAAMPLTSLVAYESLFERLEVSKNLEENQNKSILIINGSGGVGSIASQLASNVGLHVITTASRTETIEYSKQNKADLVINHHENLQKQLKDHDINEVDYVLLLTIPDYHFDQLADIIKPFGKICCIVDNQKDLNISLLKDKSISFLWEVMFTKSKYDVNMISQHHILNDISKDLDHGFLKSTRTKTFEGINAKNLNLAHQMIEKNKAYGKIVIKSLS